MSVIANKHERKIWNKEILIKKKVRKVIKTGTTEYKKRDGINLELIKFKKLFVSLPKLINSESSLVI